MSNTTNIILPLLAAAQNQKHVTVNEGLQKLDALLMCAPKSDTTTAEPGAPADGDVYILPAGKTGTNWGPAANYAIAHYRDGAWQFYAPREGFLAWIKDTDVIKFHDGAAWQPFSGIATDIAGVCDGRLTLETGVAVSASDQTAKTTLYFTPRRGYKIGLYDGSSAWTLVSFTEVSISLSGKTANTNYDVFGYNNAGTLTLELLAWSSDTARATALALQNGVYVKSGATTRRYLGTLRITGTTGQCEDSLVKRFVWNLQNRVQRPMLIADATSTWTYSTNALRQCNANAANQFAFVRGLDEDAAIALANNRCTNSTGTFRAIAAAIGLDSSTAVAPGCKLLSAACSDTSPFSGTTVYAGLPGLGYHELRWCENGAGADTQTWNGGTPRGMTGYVVA